MTELVLGLVLFLGIHSVSIVAPGFRNRMAAKSESGWKGVYALVAIVGIVMVVRGYGDARLDPTVLYTSPVWMRHLAALLMVPFFIFFLAPYFPGRIQTTLKHGQLASVKLWALAHLLVNGMLHDVLLFGSFLAWAVVERISLKRREQRPIPGAPASKYNDVILVVVGLALYVVFSFWAHRFLFGVSPIPM